MKYFSKIYLSIFIAVSLGIVYVFFSIGDIKEELTKHLNSMFVREAEMFARNIEGELLPHISKNHTLYEALQKDTSLQQRLDEKLSMLVTDHYRFVYILYKDKNGMFRYLLDGSKEDKGEFNQRLNVDTKSWLKVYETKKPLVVYQNEFESLWITYLYPIVVENKVMGVIAIDFSLDLPKNISEVISPVNQAFIYIFIAIALILLVLVYQSILNVKTRKESYIDGLTQVYNRNYLRKFSESIDLSKYQLMMLDIDHFKKVNDNYGHKVGDAILQGVAEIIKQVLRGDDVVIRFGGEEFLIFIKRKSSDEKVAYNIATRLREKVQEHPFTVDENTIYVSVSIGMNCFPEHFKSVNDAIKYADEMLYIAKRAGRNMVVSSLEHDRYAHSMDVSINDIKEALESNRIICYYQPIYAFKDKKPYISKYEALVRMIDKEGNLLLPMKFLPKIMGTNIYNDLTKQVMEIVFEKIREKQVNISMNLNISDILNNDIFAIILEELKTHKEIAKYLIIELLENENIESIEIVQERIKQIKSYGVKIAIDDFGSGYSNYVLFQKLDVDFIKIDGSIIRDIDTSNISLSVTRSIIDLSKELGKVTVAEFVHSKDVLERIEELGIDCVQGFYLSKPKEDI